MAKELKDLTKRSVDYSRWYNELVVKAELAEQSDVRGCMVIKPYGYAIWERIQQSMDARFKEVGVQNVYFPLLIPKSFLSKEAEHVEGFAKECAVVTHYRLKTNAEKTGVVVDPEAKLDEELIIRPTSETMFWNTYRKWIHSWRDLPVICNQWCNVMRWEMRTRLFLRTSEFLWQEGHTAHATCEEADQRARQMLDVYGKALQNGTSHFLGQNFAKAFGVQYVDKDNQLQYPWATSFGVSTRMMGALIMTHSDDNGLVLPPHLAPIQVVIVPIYKNDDELQKLNERLEAIASTLRSKGIRVKYDNADNKRPGFKFADYELKGVPVRLVMGGRDLQNGTIELMRRDTLEKETLQVEGIEEYVEKLLEEIQQHMFHKASKFRDEHIFPCDDYDDFKKRVKDGGFFLCPWDGTEETEAKIKEETQATIRCIPFNVDQTNPGVDMVSGKPAKHKVIIARAY